MTRGPSSSDGAPLVVTAAFPFLPATPMMGRKASTYVPANIFVRFQHLLGRRCSFVCGIDMHSIAGR